MRFKLGRNHSNVWNPMPRRHPYVHLFHMRSLVRRATAQIEQTRSYTANDSGWNGSQIGGWSLYGPWAQPCFGECLFRPFANMFQCPMVRILPAQSAAATPRYRQLLLIVWSGMRFFPDLQYTRLSSLAYDKTSLRGLTMQRIFYPLDPLGFIDFLQELDSLYSGCGKYTGHRFCHSQYWLSGFIQRAEPYDIIRITFPESGVYFYSDTCLEETQNFNALKSEDGNIWTNYSLAGFKGSPFFDPKPTW